MKRRSLLRGVVGTLGSGGVLGTGGIFSVWAPLAVGCSKPPPHSDGASSRGAAPSVAPALDGGVDAGGDERGALELRQRSGGGATMEIDAPRLTARRGDPAGAILMVFIGVSARVVTLSSLKPTVDGAAPTNRYRATVDVAEAVLAVRGAGTAPVLVHACSGPWLSGFVAVAA